MSDLNVLSILDRQLDNYSRIIDFLTVRESRATELISRIDNMLEECRLALLRIEQCNIENFVKKPVEIKDYIKRDDSQDLCISSNEQDPHLKDRLSMISIMPETS